MDISLIERMKRACLNKRYRQNYETMEACIIDVMEVYGDFEVTCPPQNFSDSIQQSDCEGNTDHYKDLNQIAMIVLAVLVALCTIIQIQTWILITRRTRYATPENIVNEISLHSIERDETSLLPAHDQLNADQVIYAEPPPITVNNESQEVEPVLIFNSASHGEAEEI